jgi:hypothetical protein
MKTFFLTAAFFCAPLVPAVLARSAPEPRGPVAVVVNPFRGESALGVVAAAEGRVVRFGRWSFVAVADHGAPGEDDGVFRERLKASGAWLLLDPLGVGACLTPGGAA